MKIRMRTSLAGNGFSIAPNDVVLVNDEGGARRLIASDQAEEVADATPHTHELDPLKPQRGGAETATTSAPQNAADGPAAAKGKKGKG